MPKAKPTPADDSAALYWSFSEIVKRTGVSTGLLQIAIKEGFVAATIRHRYQPATTLLGLIKFFLARYGKLPTYDNAEQCSQSTGIPLSLIKQVRRSSQTAFLGKRIDLAKLLRDLFTLQQEKDWRKVREKADAIMAEVAAQEALDEILQKSEVKDAIHRAMAKLFLALDNEANVNLPPVLKGCDEATIQTKLVHSSDRLKALLTDHWNKLLQSPKN